MYIDLHGKAKVINHSTKDFCELEYKERGWNGSKTADAVFGIVKSAEGKARYKLEAIYT